MREERICAFYSNGPHYVRMLQCLRESYPEATIIAAIPPTFPFDVIAGLVDETIRLPERRHPRDSWATLRQIRKARCSLFVVMFDSTRLNVLAALSGIRHRRCFTVDGRFYRLEHGVPGQLNAALRRRIRGQWDYWRAWRGTRKP